MRTNVVWVACPQGAVQLVRACGLLVTPTKDPRFKSFGEVNFFFFLLYPESGPWDGRGSPRE